MFAHDPVPPTHRASQIRISGLRTARGAGATDASLFWSSIDQRNVDKMLRFLLLTSTSFFAACILGQEKIRRERLLRVLMGLSCAILLYYAYYRYVLGVDMSDRELGGRFPAD